MPISMAAARREPVRSTPSSSRYCPSPKNFSRLSSTNMIFVNASMAILPGLVSGKTARAIPFMQ